MLDSGADARKLGWAFSFSKQTLGSGNHPLRLAGVRAVHTGDFLMPEVKLDFIIIGKTKRNNRDRTTMSFILYSPVTLLLGI